MDALDLDTPAVYVDLDALERNIARMAEQSRRWGVTLRPHTKTHKIPEIAHWQMRAGNVGICCQKIGDAEVMVAAPRDGALLHGVAVVDEHERTERPHEDDKRQADETGNGQLSTQHREGSCRRTTRCRRHRWFRFAGRSRQGLGG